MIDLSLDDLNAWVFFSSASCHDQGCAKRHQVQCHCHGCRNVRYKWPYSQRVARVKQHSNQGHYIISCRNHYAKGWLHLCRMWGRAGKRWDCQQDRYLHRCSVCSHVPKALLCVHRVTQVHERIPASICKTLLILTCRMMLLSSHSQKNTKSLI